MWEAETVPVILLNPIPRNRFQQPKEDSLCMEMNWRDNKYAWIFHYYFHLFSENPISTVTRNCKQRIFQQFMMSLPSIGIKYKYSHAMCN